MNNFDAMRRNLLRSGSLAAATAGLPALSYAALPQQERTSVQEIFDVRQYGAAGDGKTVDTPAVNRAIEAAAAAGGGVVLFPAGTYLCFSIHLKTNIHLVLQQGATIEAAASPKPGEQTGYNGGTYDA